MQPTTPSMPLTRDEVLRSLGDADDDVIAEVIATGATPAELALAIDEMRMASVRTGPPRSEPRVAELCEILGPWWEASDEMEYAGTD